MKKVSLLLLISLASSVAHAVPIASATLTGFIQNGSILNNAGSGAAISQIVYSLGTPGDGIATWDSSFGDGGGVTSDFLSDPRYFQTVTWSGLSVAAGDAFNFGGLDIDLILSLVPLSVTGNQLDLVGTSLANATLTIYWDNGSVGSANLVQQAWSLTQNLRIIAVPEPSPMVLLSMGLLVLGLRLARRPRS